MTTDIRLINGQHFHKTLCRTEFMTRIHLTHSSKGPRLCEGLERLTRECVRPDVFVVVRDADNKLAKNEVGQERRGFWPGMLQYQRVDNSEE